MAAVADGQHSNFNLTMLKEMKSNDKCAVFGYIRTIQCLLNDSYGDQNPFYIIPELVSYICLAFYACAEYFDTINHAAVYHDNQRRIAHVAEHSDNVSCYGVINIPSINGTVHIWTVQINDIGRHEARWGVVIGIDESKRSGFNGCFCFQSNTVNYGYYGQGQYWSRNKYLGRKAGFDTNDIVKMKLDLSERTLSYSKNDGDMLTIFDEIKIGENIEYCLAVHLRFASADVSLLNYVSYKPHNK